MASNSALATLVILASCMVGCSLAATVVVGGSEGWRSGYNYTDWALKHGPFYINDTLVFKNGNRSNEAHSVYLLPDLYSYVKCDFGRAELLSTVADVGETGFSYVLRQWRPQYFASGEGNATECNDGLMKFFAIPLPRWFKN